MQLWFFRRYGNRIIEPEIKGALLLCRVVAFAMLTPSSSLKPVARLAGVPAVETGEE